MHPLPASPRRVAGSRFQVASSAHAISQIDLGAAVQAANIGFTVVTTLEQNKKNLAGHAGVRGAAVRMLENAYS